MKAKPSKGKCLTDDEVAWYVDGAVKPDLRKRIEDHLLKCNACLHGVAELKQLLSPGRRGEVTLPAGARARAEAIIERRTADAPEMAITLALKAGLCRIIETTGSLLVPGRLVPAPVRSGAQPAPAPRVAKSMSGYLVTLEFVTRKQEPQPRLTIVEESSSARPDGIKAKIYAEGACETKYSRAGKVSFSALKPGLSVIEIEDVGRISLEVQPS